MMKFFKDMMKSVNNMIYLIYSIIYFIYSIIYLIDFIEKCIHIWYNVFSYDKIHSQIIEYLPNEQICFSMIFYIHLSKLS